MTRRLAAWTVIRRTADLPIKVTPLSTYTPSTKRRPLQENGPRALRRHLREPFRPSARLSRSVEDSAIGQRTTFSIRCELHQGP